MSPQPPQNDQNNKIDRKTLIVSGVLLIVPPLIPLFFIKDAQTSMGMMLMGGLSLVVFLGNALMLLVLLKWLKRMKQEGAQGPTSDGSDDSDVSKDA